MKTLTRIFFCTLAIASLYSCEPEEVHESSEPKLLSPTDTYGTGDQEDDIDDDMEDARKKK